MTNSAPSLRKLLAALVAALFFAQNVLLAHAAESNIWQERRRGQSPWRLTSSPSSLLAFLPKAESGLTVPLSGKLLTNFGIPAEFKDQKSARAEKYIPEWVQRAIAPYATIQEVSPSKNTAAKTILLL